MRYVITILLVVGCLQGCSTSSTSVRQSLEEVEILYSRPTYSSLDEVLDSARSSADSIAGLHSLLVARDGEIIMEEYMHGYEGQHIEHVRSVTKSVMSLLIGIAIDRGVIESVDQPISDYFYDLLGTNKEKIKIKHLLTMSSGLDWSEETGSSEYFRWWGSGKPVDYVLDKGLSDPPGETFNYNTGALHLLSVILTKASGMSTLEFANKYLFEPLGIDNVRWEYFDGYYNGGAGLELLPTDMYKIGQLMLNGGVYSGNRVVSESWVAESAESHVTLFKKDNEHAGYGYCWWIYEVGDERFFGAQGFAGQKIYVFPSLDIVVVTTAQWTRMRDRINEQTLSIYKLVTGNIALPLYQNRNLITDPTEDHPTN